MSERPPRRRHTDDIVRRVARVFGFGLLLLLVYLLHLQGDHQARQQRQLNRQQGQVRGLVAQVDRAAHDIATDYVFLYESCVRLQIVRVEDNVSHYADYRVFRTFVQLASDNRALAPLLKQARLAVAAKTWVPVTDCQEAVNAKGARYRPPKPVPFARRLPPRSALYLPNNLFE